MNNLFYKCVSILKWLAELLNMTYEEVNVWIFIIIEPVIFLLMLIYIIVLRNKNKSNLTQL